jgi:hypothetical protein
MTKSSRSRSEGWQHAKKDGHANETQFAKELLQNRNFISEIEKKIGTKLPGVSPRVDVDGSKQVKSIFGDLTVSKVDLALKWQNLDSVNISLKKSPSGQVWLVTLPRFVAAIEYHSGKKLTGEELMGLSLFIGGENLGRYEKYYREALLNDSELFPRIANQEKHQSRLVASSIERNFPSIWQSTLRFMNKNIALITKLSFAQGLAESPLDSANLIVYNKKKGGPAVFLIPKIIAESSNSVRSCPIKAGPRNGGSTLILPTGFLQMHHPKGSNQLQFHHKYEEILKLSS